MARPAVPDDLAQWSLHCFCPKARRNPKRIVELDNNGQILFRSIGGKTLTEIRADGIPINESQLVLLETFGLIERDGDQVRTRMPVLPPDSTSVIRDAVAAAARRAVPGVSEAAKDIVSKLASRDLEASAWAIIFGHALDGVLWDSLRRRGHLPEIELTVDEPLWRGALWAVYPGREGSAGTNELGIGRNHLVMVWDDASAAALRELASHPGIRALLTALAPEDHRVSLPSSVDGYMEIPVITREDEIHTEAVKLAEEVADVMPDSVTSRGLLADSGVVASPEEATVILAHELIWEVAARLEGTDVVSTPPTGDTGRRLFVRVDQ